MACVCSVGMDGVVRLPTIATSLLHFTPPLLGIMVVVVVKWHTACKVGARSVDDCP